MSGRKSSKVLKILVNRRIITLSILLCLVVFCIFEFTDYFYVNRPARATEATDFVIKADENLVQPIDYNDAISYTKTDAIIFERSLNNQNGCIKKYVTPVNPDFNIDLSSIKLTIPVLMYHYVENPGSTTLPWLYHSPEIFEAQLKTLSSHCYTTIFVSDVAKSINGAATLPDHSIALTFDDGYEDMYTKAFPLLKKYGMKGTMYIIVNALDTPGYLTKAQAKEMSDSGFVEIAGHTFNHANLSKTITSVANYEIIGSKRELEKIIDHPVTDFAYPYGLFTSRDEKICYQAGYLSCASTYPGQVQTYAKRFSLYRLRPGYRVGPALINWLEQPGPKR